MTLERQRERPAAELRLFCAVATLIVMFVSPAPAAAPEAARQATVEEIRALFEVATRRPPRSRFVGDITITEQPWTEDKIRAELSLQLGMLQAGGYEKQKQLAFDRASLSNAIARQASGTRVFHVREWYSANKYRLDQTEASSVPGDSISKKEAPTYRDTYVDIHDDGFSPYQSYSVDHQLKDALLTTNPGVRHAPYRLWESLGMCERVGVPLVTALADRQSMPRLPPGVARDVTTITADASKAQKLHDDSDPNWHLEATDEQLRGAPVTRFKLSGRCLDLWSPPVPLSSLRTSGLPQLEITYWVRWTAPRPTCVRSFLTNLSQHTSFSSAIEDFDKRGYPLVWETRSMEEGVLRRALRAVFEDVEDSPSFSDQEAFAPVFPDDYCVSDITSGKAVVLHKPALKLMPLPKPIPSRRKRRLVLAGIILMAAAPLAIAYWLRRKAPSRIGA